MPSARLRWDPLRRSTAAAQALAAPGERPRVPARLGRRSATPQSSEPTEQRAEREERKPDEEEPPAAEQIGDPPAQQEGAAEHDRVGGDHPLQVLLGEAEIALDRGQGDVTIVASRMTMNCAVTTSASDIQRRNSLWVPIAAFPTSSSSTQASMRVNVSSR
jgi:hypothetical protein